MCAASASRRIARRLFVAVVAVATQALAATPFFTGADANYTPAMEHEGRTWADAQGKQGDPFELLARAGFDRFRIRLWTGDDGTNGLNEETALALRAQRAGLKPYLVLFLSENWADMVKQPAPPIWRDLDDAAKVAAIEAYAERVTRHFADAGVSVDLFEIGNEIDFGLCGVFEEEWPKRVSIDYMRSRIWPRMVTLIAAAQRGVRKVQPQAKFVLHLAQWMNADYCIAFFKEMLARDVAVDIAGLTYFPTSVDDASQRPLGFFDQQMTRIGDAIDRPVMICESGYPSASNFGGQFASWNKPVEGYSLDEAGQRRWLSDYLATARANRRVAGVVYWSPEWYASDMWSAFALFDADGKARPALSAVAATQPASQPTSQPTTQPDVHVYFGNLHAHTGYSDGTGTPAEAFAYARDVAKLDVLAVTDHNHLLGGDKATPQRRAELYNTDPVNSVVATADAANVPGKFVAIAGQEFSSMSKGNHLNVFDVREVIDVPNGKFDELLAWCDKHRDSTGQPPILQFNHPMLGKPGKTIDANEYGRDDFGNDAGWIQHMGAETPLIELLNGEEGEGPNHDRAPQIMDRFYRLYLQRGFKVAPTGNQDNHHRHWGDATAARTGIIAAELTRPAILDAMRHRHVYATEDANLRLIVRVNGQLCGDELAAPSDGPTHLSLTFDDADEPNAAYTIDLFKGTIDGKLADVVATTQATGNTQQPLQIDGPALGARDYLFLRVSQSGEQVDRVWTAPVWGR